MEMIKVWVDGAARPNPGKGAVGVVIRSEDFGYSISKRIAGNKITNNEAEYWAFKVALTELLLNQLTNEEITIYSDSEMLVKQLNEKLRVESGSYMPQYVVVTALKKQFPKLWVKWIPREENSEANLLASQGLNKEVEVE